MKILIADDHELVREGLRKSLNELDNELEILEAANFQQACCIIQDNSDLSLALIDLNMPDMNGIVAINKIMDDAPTTPVVVLSASNDINDMREVLDSGAMGYIPKSESSAVILSALKLVLSGGVYIPLALVSHSRQTDSLTTSQSTLTPRQTEVLKFLAKGKSNKKIASELGIADATIKVHLSAIYKTLEVNNRTQAVLKAAKLGLVK